MSLERMKNWKQKENRFWNENIKFQIKKIYNKGSGGWVVENQDFLNIFNNTCWLKDLIGEKNKNKKTNH